MKYAIYDKAADGYLTKMEFEVGYSDNIQFECGYNEYITEAQLLDTPKEVADAIVRIESFKFMDKGRFVVHSFDDRLKDQYIISEAGEPTKVVDNITVDLDGKIDVKYGTMPLHWSASSLDYVVNRLNRLQDASAPSIYTSWNNTFDIYKVITVIDERSCTHYQFIKVTEKGLTEYAKNEVDPFNKRIEELEKANYELGVQVTARGATANRLQEENDNLKTKVESIKKEARNWKKFYENADEDRTILKNAIDIIYTDLKLAPKYGDKSYKLKAALDSFKRDDALARISMPTEVYYIQNNGTYLTARDEVCAIIDQILNIMESNKSNKKTVYAAEEIPKAIANDVIAICEADDTFDVTLKKFSELYESIWIPGTNDDTIAHAFKSVLKIFSTMESELENYAAEIVGWKHQVQKAAKDLENQKKLNGANKATITQMVVEKHAMDKELSDAADALNEVNDKNEGLMNMLKEVTGYIADIMFVTRTVNRDTMISELVGISNKIGYKTSDDGPMFGILVILNTLIRISKDGAYFERHLEEAKNVVTVITKERDKALERAEFYKRQANSVYGMTVPTRCCGKQVMTDILSGKKIPIDKKKYDDLVEYVANINLTYDNMFCMMDKPVYLYTITESLNDLTK